MTDAVVLFWFRRDLRFDDNAGLFAALSSGRPVVPVFIFDTDILNELPDRDDKRVSFLFATLRAMQTMLQKKGSTLDVRYGRPREVFAQLLNEYSVSAVYTNHDYEPYATQRDGELKTFLGEQNVAFHTSKDQVIFERDEVVKDDGTPYAVFTPYAKKWKTAFAKASLAHFDSEGKMNTFHRQPARAFPSLSDMGFVFDEAIFSLPSVDEAIIRQYHQTRNTPSVQGTSRLGVHLRFGTVSVRRLVATALKLNETFLTELIWREYFMQLLWHHPRLVKEACKKQYDNIRWRNNEAEFARWCEGKTGFPIVDAGIRELNETGFMHNRVRMIVASFLVKDLLIDWRWGEAYFARKLMDYELASNNGNWQWVAGCGCDAAPYFRVFNPSAQAKKFDPKSLYIRRWVPEVAAASYPPPMVNHNQAKDRCLNVYKEAVRRPELSD